MVALCPVPRSPKKPPPTRDLQELTARNQLRFLRTEIAVARSLLRIALRHNLRRGHRVTKRLVAIAEEAYTTAARFLAAARIDESVRVQLRRDLAEIRRALKDLR